MLDPTPAPEPIVDDLVGRVIGTTYRIVRVIGEGGTGRVYEANHTRIGSKRFAVKVLHPEFVRHPEAWGRFQREAESTGAIRHPNVVDVYDVDRTDDGRPYVVYEFLEGIELGALIDARGPLPPRLCARIVQQVCDGLAAAHARGVIHRDVKPQNVWLVGDLADPTVKVLDFGLSRLRDDDATALTKTGAVLGTPAYMAPEQARGEQVDVPSDVYGAGAILYHAATGRAPFEEETVQQTLIAVMAAEPLRPRTIVPIVPEALELVIQRAMAKEPGDRYPSVEALADALDAFVERPLPLSVRPPPSQAPAASASRGMLALHVAGALTLALTAAATLAVGAAHAIAGPDALSDRELVLVLLALFSTAVTPTALWLRHLKRTVWQNSVKVQELLQRLRRVTVASVAAYGLAALAVRALDTVVARFTDSALVGAAGGPAWTPFNLIFGLAAVAAGALAWVADRRRDRARPLLAVALLVIGAIVYQGLAWRSAEVTVPKLEAALTKTQGLRAVDAEAIATAAARVSDDELAAAVAHGTDALTDLAARYPRDPAVLQALALALGRGEKRRGEAIAVLTRLFGLSPDLARDRGLRALVSKAARDPDSRDAALALMVTEMGREGLDLLYELMLGDKALRPKIETMLASPELRARFSPALAIAYELRTAEGCAGREPLLDRAARLGDERAIAVLAPLSEGTKTGCGAWKRKPCDPPCPDQAEAFKAAVRAIQQRIER